MSNKQQSTPCLPVIQAPMFLLSGPEMVLASCRSGIIGSFPATNARTIEILEQWLQQITSTLNDESCTTPWALNLITHRSNPRQFEEVKLAIKYQVPIIITALGSPKGIVDEIHSYGGKVFADVITVDYAKKAADTGVDGLALVCSGAGGHTGQISPFAFVEEVRQFFDGEIILSGAISNGRAIRAAQILGADYVYMGTRFIATHESMAQMQYKQMVVDSTSSDIIVSDSITGVKANWLKDSLIKVGFDPSNMPPAAKIDMSNSSDSKRWKDIWAAGQGVGATHAISSIAEVVEQLREEYDLAKQCV